jgi:undecaprenyl diphosphate synthase
MAEAATIPRHIGFILDGNRRWAKKHGLPTYEGHLAGYNAIQEVAREAFRTGVSCVSAYIFSTENWRRSQEEVRGLMKLVLKLLTSDLKQLEDENIRLKILGSREGVSDKILQAIDEAETRTAGNTRGTLAICFNYGGQLEVAEACKKIIQQRAPVNAITPELITQHLYAPEVPPVDVVVRTSGEQRISNFMLWRAAYSEFIFLEKLWPDMTKDDVSAILEEYSRRGRRFGG